MGSGSAGPSSGPPGDPSALGPGHRHPCAVRLRSGASVRGRCGLGGVPARHRLPPCEPVLRGVRLSTRQRCPRFGWPVRGSDGGRQRPRLRSMSCWGARQASQGRDGKRSLTNAVCRPWLEGRSVAVGPTMHGPVVPRVLPCFRDSIARSPRCAFLLNAFDFKFHALYVNCRRRLRTGSGSLPCSADGRSRARPGRRAVTRPAYALANRTAPARESRSVSAQGPIGRVRAVL